MGCARGSLQAERRGPEVVTQEPTENVRDGLKQPIALFPGLRDPLCLCCGPMCLYFRTRARLRNL